MKVIVAGTRTFTDPMFLQIVDYAIRKSGFYITELVCGMANGIDGHGHEWAENVDIPIKEFPAEWKKYKRSAGPIRNAEMAEYADALIIIWDGESAGSKNMKNNAIQRGLKVYELVLKEFNY